MRNGTVLLVDDEPNAIRVLSSILKNDGYTVLESPNVEGAIDIIHRKPVDAIITDLRMPGKDGYQLFQHVSEKYPALPFLFLTAYGTVESAVQAMSSGAFYYFIKPPDYGKLKSILAQAVEQRHLHYRCMESSDAPPEAHGPYRLIGQSQSMRNILGSIESVKDSESSVLIRGETGTGKEVIAGNLHFRGKRGNRPFIAVNCAAIPRDLIEAELFGSTRGAYTGSFANRVGKFEDAADGTVFLDEIGELELAVQAKLLRALQERTIERLGSNRKIRVRFRLICSTNRNLEQDIKEGKFREDLFYRINVVQIVAPPLRDHREDIPLLATEFVREFCHREKKEVLITNDAMDVLLQYHWPGNVRQLRNVIERSVVLAEGPKIAARHLPDDLVEVLTGEKNVRQVVPLKALERQAVTSAVAACQGNKSQAARRLGISRKALYSKLRETP